MKCKVKDCENHEHEGLFIGFLCSPCYTFLTEGQGKHSQLYRNTIAAEREACAKVCESLNEDFDHLYVSACADVIRARGQG
jgi:hypothetical protein